MPHDLPKSYEPGAIETRWAEYWIKERLFSVPTPPPGETRPVFTLLLPPPNVTGRLHMGHMLNQTQMDIIVRWHRMRGFLTLWLPGTDHAGIATQMMVERQLASEGTKRQDLGREKFIERVWEWKRHYGGAILDQMKRLGASVDWDREYFTMDENLSRAVREVFVRLYEEGLIYRGKYIVNWCPRCGTAISDLEVKHEDVPGKLYEIRYPVIGTNEFITVATTRPETMLGDTAVAVNERDERYQHLWDKKVLLPLMDREIPIITDELAQPEFGTGAVKVTPAHDPNDFQAGLRHHLPQIDVMDEHAYMNQNAGPYAGLSRHAAREKVLEDLRTQGFLVGEKDYTIAIGKCDRCGTVVEPRLSTQWFIKIQPLADPAIEAVESGEITIVPENYKQIYLNWMRNIHDWCISRQLWWGHRIPAWHCACREIIVARVAPAKCAKCGKTELKQDTDVLDTWFSSGLLPFTTLGWPEKARDHEVFYPTTLLITAYEILFFWVARMIMFGCHFMQGHKQDPALKQASGWCAKNDDSVPFRQVYIHALVRDAERQKMSKTKGNVLDPLQVIEKYGTDATRFTLAAMAAPGTDIAFNESRTQGYRNFANKIWNAARFMFMNVDRAERAGIWKLGEFTTLPDVLDSEVVAGFQPKTLEDRWVLAGFTKTALDVGAELRAYRFHEAANRIYDFFWGDFCDWYIELIKPRLAIQGNTDRETVRVACGNLVSLFERSLRLLHPVMPFITEDIWQAVYDGKPPSPLKSVAFAPYPFAKNADKVESGYVDSQSEAVVVRLYPTQVLGEDLQRVRSGMQVLQDLIVSVRNWRAENKVEPKVKLSIQLSTHSEENRDLIMQNQGAVERLANVEAIAFVDGPLVDTLGARHAANFDFLPIYEKKINIAADRDRLNSELEKIEREIANGERQLGNEQFLAKAPAHVVEGIRRRTQDLATQRERTISQLRALGQR